MGEDLQEDDFTEARIAEVRQTVREMMAASTLTMKQVSRESGIAYSTLSAFMSGTYLGTNPKQALLLSRWMTARATNASVRSAAPQSPDFVPTRTSEQIVALLEHAQHTPDFAVVMGAPGIGKTATGRAYAKRSHNVFMLTCQPTGRSAGALMWDLADLVSANVGGFTSAARQGRLLQQKLGQLNSSLIILDEAQHLSSTALDQMRTLHDLCNCGVALMGNASIFRRLEGGTRSADYAQLFSRVGMRLERKRVYPEDVETLLDAWRIEDGKVRAVARAVARKSGALRSMTKVIRQAHLRAAANGEPLTERDMLDAARQLGIDDAAAAAAA